MKTGRVDEWWFFLTFWQIWILGASAGGGSDLHYIIVNPSTHWMSNLTHLSRVHFPLKKISGDFWATRSQRCVNRKWCILFWSCFEYSSLWKCTWKWGVPLLRKVNWACRIDETVPSFCSANETDIDICQNLFISSNSSSLNPTGFGGKNNFRTL